MMFEERRDISSELVHDISIPLTAQMLLQFTG